MEVLGTLYHFIERESPSLNSKTDVLTHCPQTLPRNLILLTLLISSNLMASTIFKAFQAELSESFSLITDLSDSPTVQSNPVALGTAELIANLLFGNSSSFTAEGGLGGGYGYDELEVNINFKQGQYGGSISGAGGYTTASDGILSPYLPTPNTTSQPGTSSEETFDCLKHGSQGPRVFTLQKQLIDLDFFSANPTGYFGEITENAVIQFQYTNNLTVDGVVGPETASRLNQIASGQSAPGYQAAMASVNPRQAALPRQSSQATESAVSRLNIGAELFLENQGADVEQLQRFLKLAGYYKEDVTGYFGPITMTAVKEFQADHNLPITGIVGVKTLLKLNEVLN